MVRLVIAVTEDSSLNELWRGAMRHLQGASAELHGVFLADDRWHQAASLSISCEVSKIGGAITNFTAQRADLIREESIARVRHHMERLASEADLAFAFDVLAESDHARIQELVGGAGSTVVAPALLTRHPVYAQMERLGCRIVIIKEADQARSSVQHEPSAGSERRGR